MDLLDRTIREIKEESAVITQHLQRWWNGMGISEQAFSLGIICAAFLLIGILQPAPKRTVEGYENNQNSGLVKQFLLATVVLLIMTFGLDIAIENVS